MTSASRVLSRSRGRARLLAGAAGSRWCWRRAARAARRRRRSAAPTNRRGLHQLRQGRVHRDAGRGRVRDRHAAEVERHAADLLPRLPGGRSPRRRTSRRWRPPPSRRPAGARARRTSARPCSTRASPSPARRTRRTGGRSRTASRPTRTCTSSSPTRSASPNRVIVWGDSLGGLITEVLSREAPGVGRRGGPVVRRAGRPEQEPRPGARRGVRHQDAHRPRSSS